MAEALHAGIAGQVCGEALDLLIQQRGVFTAELHQVNALCRDGRIGREVLGHVMPDDVLHRQIEHPRIHRFDGQRCHGHQCLGISERVHKAGVGHIHQHRVLRDRQYVEGRLDDKAERSF